MSYKFDRNNWIQKAKLAGLTVAAVGAAAGVAVFSYWSSNYFGLKRLPGYVATEPLTLEAADLASKPLQINYRVLNLDKYVFLTRILSFKSQ